VPGVLAARGMAGPVEPGSLAFTAGVVQLISSRSLVTFSPAYFDQVIPVADSSRSTGMIQTPTAACQFMVRARGFERSGRNSQPADRRSRRARTRRYQSTRPASAISHSQDAAISL